MSRELAIFVVHNHAHAKGRVLTLDVVLDLDQAAAALGNTDAAWVMTPETVDAFCRYVTQGDPMGPVATDAGEVLVASGEPVLLTPEVVRCVDPGLLAVIAHRGRTLAELAAVASEGS